MYDNFVKVCKEATANVIPLKPKRKKKYTGKLCISVRNVKYITRQLKLKKAIKLKEILKTSQRLKIHSHTRMKETRGICYSKD